MWKTIREISGILQISEKSVRRRIKMGEWQVKREAFGHGNRLLIFFSQSPSPDEPKGEQIGQQVGQQTGQQTGQKREQTGQQTGQKSEQVGQQIGQNVTPVNCQASDPTAITDIVCMTKEEIHREVEELCKNAIIPQEIQSLPEPSHPDWLRARMDDRKRAWAKFYILQTFIAYRREYKAQGINFSESGESFVKKLHNGELCLEAFNYLRVKSIPLPTLIRWVTLLNESGDINSPVCLLEGFRHCGRKSKLDVELRNWIRELAVDERHLDPGWIYLYLIDQLSIVDQKLTISERTMQRTIREFRKEVITISMGKGKKAMKDKVKLHNVRINDLLPGELWESDGHVCNLLVKSPFYCHRNYARRYLVRPTVIFWMDIATGTITGYRACLSENKGAVRNSLYDGIARFGVPQKIRMDNGSSYKCVEYAPAEFYKESQGKKRLTAEEKIAKRMLENGDKGLYGNLGIEYHFTIPGNPESKSIEPAWRYCLDAFEKSFPSWIGNNQESRPEIFKNMDNKTLARKYKDMFPTWDEFLERLDKYIFYYNSKLRASLLTIDGEKLSPIEAYNQVEHTIPNALELISKMRDPYIEMKTVQRSMIEKNGILYWHPAFASLIGTKVGIFYDEKNLQEIIVCNERGQMYPEKAIAIDPGLQSGDDLIALIENNRRAKIGKLYYLATIDVTGAMKVEKMLNLLGKELLPLSNTKEEEEVKYLNFDEALEAVASEIEETDVIEDKVKEKQQDDIIKHTAEELETIEELKKDMAGMFG